MHPRELSIADFTYELPEGRIAQQPLAERDASKLLVWRDGRINDRRFRELPEELPPGALLVLNETKVVNARLIFRRSSGARIEVLCLSPSPSAPVELALAHTESSLWHCFIGNAKRWKEGEELMLSSGGVEITAMRTGNDQVRFNWRPMGKTFAQVLEALGHVPLPPYMKRADAPADKERYNTVFAERPGSVAAPTASLHFTPAMLESLRARGIDATRLTLHVGAGTFLPVKSERMEGHAMHEEEVSVTRAAIKLVLERWGRSPIIAVGTTALRTLESLYWHGLMLVNGGTDADLRIGQWEPYEASGEPRSPRECLEAVLADLDRRGAERLTGRTRLLIAPGYRFRLVDGLITNFHQPQSTLLLLVAAFVGPDWRRIYDHALANGYRFLSYGDASLLWRADRLSTVEA